MQACYGHTEGAAGVTGALLAIAATAHGQAAPIVNLRALNPYVGAAMEQWVQGGTCGPAAARAASPAVTLAGQMAGGLHQLHDCLAAANCTSQECQTSRLLDIPPAHAMRINADCSFQEHVVCQKHGH